MNSWENTARVGYGFTEPTVNQLKSDYPRESSMERAYQAYLKWKMNNGYISVTAWTMLQILHEAGEFEAIEYLTEKLKCSENI